MGRRYSRALLTCPFGVRVPSLARQTSLPLLFLLMKLLLAGLSFMMIWLDVAVFDTQILEISFTEITQELMLFACALLFWCAPGAAPAAASTTWPQAFSAAC